MLGLLLAAGIMCGVSFYVDMNAVLPSGRVTELQTGCDNKIDISHDKNGNFDLLSRYNHVELKIPKGTRGWVTYWWLTDTARVNGKDIKVHIFLGRGYEIRY